MHFRQHQRRREGRGYAGERFRWKIRPIRRIMGVYWPRAPLHAEISWRKDGNGTMYPTAEILFPLRIAPHLKDLRGPRWRELVSRVASLPETHPDALAFVLMMIRLNECLRCHRESYRYQQGCLRCSTQSVVYFKGTDEDLLKLYEQAQRDIRRYMREGKLPVPAEVA